MMNVCRLDDLIQYTALHWLREFLNMPQCHQVLLPHSAGLLSAVLPCYSYDDDSRQNILFFCLSKYFFFFETICFFLNHHKHTFERQPKKSIIFYDN